MVSSNLQPQDVDFDLEWAKLKKVSEDIFAQQITRTKYQESLSLVYKLCVATEPKSQELYQNLSDFLGNKAAEIARRLNSFEGEDLLEQYEVEWDGYQTASDSVDKTCSYLNKEFIDRRHYDNAEMHMVDNTSVDSYLRIKDLAFEKWRYNVLDAIDEKLVTSCIRLVKRIRLDENVQFGQKHQVQVAVSSFLKVCDHKARNKLELYEEKFETRFLEQTSEFYNDQAQRFLESGDVGWYMEQVLTVIENENSLAEELLDRSTIAKQKDRIVKSLIYDGLDFLFDKAQLMVRTENAGQLKKLYLLFQNMETPLARLVKMFKTYVEEIGIEKIKDAKTAKDFVDLVCQHYDKYKEFVDTVFVTQEKMQDYTEQKPRFEPDKNFLESLKDAMRTIVNYKEGTQRSRAPDLLAQYSDQLLKKRGSDDIDSKLDEIIKALEFVSEKDLFQANYTRRLAKRLIYGHSSSNDAERQMIEKLKGVCVYDFTSKIKRMYEDITKSVTQQEAYNKTVPDTSLGLDVKVLQDGSWPFTRTQPSFILPRSLEPHIESYSRFYEDQHKNRTLKWMYTMSQAEVKTMSTSKMYLLHVTTFQLGILLNFNEMDQCSFKDLSTVTGLEPKEMMKHLKPIVVE